MAYASNKSKKKKFAFSQVAQVTLFFLTVFIFVFLMVTRNSNLRLLPKASVSDVTLSFQPVAATLSTPGKLKVMVQAGGNSVGFARVKVLFDKTRINLTGTPVIHPQFQAITTPVTAAVANGAGNIEFILGLSPTNKVPIPTGSITLVEIPYTLVSTSSTAAHSVTFDTANIQIVDLSPKDLTYTIEPYTFSQASSPTPTIISGTSPTTIISPTKPATTTAPTNMQSTPTPTTVSVQDDIFFKPVSLVDNVVRIYPLNSSESITYQNVQVGEQYKLEIQYVVQNNIKSDTINLTPVIFKLYINDQEITSSTEQIAYSFITKHRDGAGGTIVANFTAQQSMSFKVEMTTEIPETNKANNTLTQQITFGSVIPNVPSWFFLLPTNLRGFLEQLYLTVFVFQRETSLKNLLQGIAP